MVTVGENDQSVRLAVERVKGRGYDVSVTYMTWQMLDTEAMTQTNILLYPAIEGQDFRDHTGSLMFRNQTQVCLIQTMYKLGQFSILFTQILSNFMLLKKMKTEIYVNSRK